MSFLASGVALIVWLLPETGSEELLVAVAVCSASGIDFSAFGSSFFSGRSAGASASVSMVQATTQQQLFRQLQ
jgi:hypothetical protein